MAAWVGCGASTRGESDASAPMAGDGGFEAEVGGGRSSGGRDTSGGQATSGGAETSGGAATSGTAGATSGGTAGNAWGGAAGSDAAVGDGGGEAEGGTASEGGRPWLPGSGDGLPVPENCQVLRRQEVMGTTSCHITLGCDEAVVSGSCEADGTGQYRCTCSVGDDSQVYRVTSPDPLAACETVDQICGSRRHVLAPGSCWRRLEYENIEACQIEEECRRPLEVPGGVTATLTEDRRVSCVDEGEPGRLSCTYYGANLNPREYFVSGADGRTACEALAGFASEQSDRVFTEPKQCTLAFQEAATEQCQIAETCTRSLELGGGVQLELRSSQGASCQRLGPETNCSCGSDLGELVFWTGASPGDIETCERAREPCLVEGALELDGSASCQRGTQYTDADTCTTEFECFQPARFGDEPIRAYVDLGLTCRRLDAETPWVCTCSGETLSNYEVEATEAWEACDEGAVKCLETKPRNRAVGF